MTTMERTDPSLNDETGLQSYEEYRLQEALPLARFSCLLGCAAAMVFYWLDDQFLPRPAAEFLKAARLYYMLPVTLLWFSMTFFASTRRHLHGTITVTGLPIGLSFVYVLYLVGEAATLYVGIALTQVCLFLTLLFGMPLRYMLFALTIFLMSFFAIVFANDTPINDIRLAATAVLAVSIIGIAVTLQTEMRQRRAFRQKRELTQLRRAEEKKKDDRIQWLQGFSGFLRHELKTALSGISTSLQMIQRHSKSTDIGRFADRAERSIRFMSQLLQRTAVASTLETALQDEKYDPVDLVDLTRIKFDEYRDAYPDVQFLAEKSTTRKLLGNGERLEEALDKIVSNAVEHTHHECPIELRIGDDGKAICISVTNYGDPLPLQGEQLFQVFFSTKARNKNTSNLGIGLFIARTIVEHMGGSISARSTGNPHGAVFEIRLPFAAAP